MCGIVGAVSRRDIAPVLIEGLRRLEYRGYDSCGIAFWTEQGLMRTRSIARVAELESQIARARLGGSTGIAHTRWATHGVPSSANAHPHFSPAQGSARTALVHNGIVENYESLRANLERKGYQFRSDTDSEVIVHFIDSLYDGDLLAATWAAVSQLRGAYAIAVSHCDEPHRLIGARCGSPLVVGVGEGEYFLASDALALSDVAGEVVYLGDGEFADLELDRFRLFDADGAQIERAAVAAPMRSQQTSLGPFRHYMQKEIFEQPESIEATLAGIDVIAPEIFGARAGAVLQRIDSVQILACGTSYYAGMVARNWIEALAGIPAQVETASEYRYRRGVSNPRSLLVTISQSGETADTLGALRHAQAVGVRNTLTICNVPTSALVRESSLAFLTQAGAEIGVASTKAFTTQLVGLLLLALVLAKQRKRLGGAAEAEMLTALAGLPQAVRAALATEVHLIAWARELAQSQHALYLGRGTHYPIALEGALKLKEVSYIHAEAYPAGELKHGPLALVTEAMPVVALTPDGALAEKMRSNLEEVRARGGRLFVLCDRGVTAQSAGQIVRLPEHHPLLSPIVHAVPLQLLAYHAGVERGADIDKPRNLAKSVTVE